MSVYQPAEDSYFLAGFVGEFVKNYKPKRVLDMGAGSGVQGEVALKSGVADEGLTLVDVDLDVVEVLKKKFPNSDVVCSDLFENVSGKYDLMIFNPPYLPDDEFDVGRDTAGGEKGSEVLNRFLKCSKDYLDDGGSVLVLVSSFTRDVDFCGYEKEVLGKKKLFFEELCVLRLFNIVK